MTDDDRKRAAQAIIEFPFLMEVFNEIETAAINATLNAKYDDHEGRQAHAAEARAIRRVLSRIRSLAEDKSESVSRRAPA